MRSVRVRVGSRQGCHWRRRVRGPCSRWRVIKDIISGACRGDIHARRDSYAKPRTTGTVVRGRPHGTVTSASPTPFDYETTRGRSPSRQAGSLYAFWDRGNVAAFQRDRVALLSFASRDRKKRIDSTWYTDAGLAELDSTPFLLPLLRADIQ